MRATTRQLGRALATTAALVLASTTGLRAEVWVLGQGGQAWSAHAGVAAGLDLTDRTTLGPIAFAADENITQALSWVKSSPEDWVAEGVAHAWDNAAIAGAAENSALALVDGDATTSTGDRFTVFGVNQTGRIFSLDLGAAFPASRIVFYPPPSQQDSYLRSYELAISSGRDYGQDQTPIFDILRQVEVNRDRLSEVVFPTQLLRFVRLRVLASNPFVLGEIEVYGEGFVPRGRYESTMVQLPAAANFGQLSFRATKVRRQEDGTLSPDSTAAANVSVQLRNGEDETPTEYYVITDLETRREELATKAEYDAAMENLRGTVRDDLTYWSPWTEAVVADESGEYTLPLELPGPRSYFLLRLLFEGNTTDAIMVDNLAIDYSSPLVASAIGEVALLSEPNPERGWVSSPAGIDTTLTYDILADVGSPARAGFDGVRIMTGAQAEFVGLEMGDPLVAVEADSTRAANDELRVYFPSHRIDAGRAEHLRVTFRTRVLLYSTLFEGQLLDSQGRLPQMIQEGDANPDVGANSLRVLFSSGSAAVLNSFGASTSTITPNGDGRNDQGVFTLVIVHLTQPASSNTQIHDLSGRPVRQLFDGALDAGSHEQIWDGKDQNGQLVPPGIYMARVTVESEMDAESRSCLVHVAY